MTFNFINSKAHKYKRNLLKRALYSWQLFKEKFTQFYKNFTDHIKYTSNISQNSEIKQSFFLRRERNIKIMLNFSEGGTNYRL